MQINKPINEKIDQATKFAKEQVDQKTGPPIGYIRATINIRKDLYKQLKIKAASEDTTVRAIIERLIEGNLNNE